MTHRLMVVPASDDADLHDAALNLIREGTKRGLQMGHFQPVVYEELNNQTLVSSFTIEQVENFLSAGSKAEFLEKLVSLYENVSANQDIIIIEGLPYCKEPYLANLNADIATAFDAYLIFIGGHKKISQSKLIDQIKMTKSYYRYASNTKILGFYIDNGVTQFGEFCSSISNNLQFDIFNKLT